MRATIAAIVVIVAVMVLLVLLLPSKHDQSVAGWWRRVRTQANLTMRVVVVLAVAAGVMLYVVLPILGWMDVDSPF